MLKVLNVVGARPNFMKIAPLIKAMKARPNAFDPLLIHTGQHYDERMSEAFFDDLGLPRPDHDLGVGSGSHAVQTARVMTAFEQVCDQHDPDLVVVVGDVNSTLACALTARKLGIPVAHVEAGLRSGDRAMPEEINRICTDAISDVLFTTDHGSADNLRAEGISDDRIVFAGNVMIDTLLEHRQRAAHLSVADGLGLRGSDYVLLTLHRPSNVDQELILRGILQAAHTLAQSIPVVFPAHPRTQKRIEDFGLEELLAAPGEDNGIRLTAPLGYLEFLNLTMGARLVLTDSGGLQEETTVLGIPCLTLRYNTERPITLEQGSNELVGTGEKTIIEAARRTLDQPAAPVRVPEGWDGKAGERIVRWISNNL